MVNIDDLSIVAIIFCAVMIVLLIADLRMQSRRNQRRKFWMAQDKPRRRKEFPDPLDPEISVEMVNWGHGTWQ